MKILSTAKKRGKIKFLVQNINYNNIQASVTQSLPHEYKMLLSRFSDTGNDFTWYTDSDNLDFRPFMNASQEEKENIGEYLKTVRPLAEKVIKSKEFSSHADAILNIPEQDNIFFAYDSNDKLIVTLTQWGFTSIGNNNPSNIISRIINENPKRREDLILHLLYSYGDNIANKDFYVNINGGIRTLRTNSSGVYNLGNTIVTKEFEISLDPEMKEDTISIDIEDGKTEYQVIFPKYTNVYIQVLNQYNEPYNKGALIVNDREVNIDEEGNAVIDKIEYLKDKKIDVSLLDENSKQQQFNINENENHFLFKVDQDYDCFVKITTKSAEDTSIGNYKLQVKTAEDTSFIFTDSNGIAILPNRIIGEEIEITDWNNSSNSHTIKLQREENLCEVIVEELVDKQVKINLIDHKKNPIKGIPISIKTRNGEKEVITDLKGEIILPYDHFEDGEKVRCSFSAEKINGKRKEKVYKTDFIFDENILDYTLRIKKRNLKWLWLLLLLLILPLFINQEKSVSVKVSTMDSIPIPNSTVSFEYTSNYLYKNGKFFNKEKHDYEETTNADGIAVFDKIGYSVFSTFFHVLSRAKIKIVAKCEEQKEPTNPLFHFIRESKPINIFLKQKLIDITVKVIDRELIEPISGVEVNFVYSTANGDKEVAHVSDENGFILLKQVCYCGTIKSITANEYGYKAYSLSEIDVMQILKEDPNIMVKLIPEKSRIQFYVKNKYTKEAIPNALATITLTDKRDNKSKSSTVKTNVDGMGCGFYDDIFILADINIDAECKYFKKGNLPYGYRVDEFINLPDSLRTIYLLPEEYVQTFQNIDSISKKPIKGVLNNITVESANGQTYVDTQISNNNGIFNIKAHKGDKITIESISNPHYNNKIGEIIFDGDHKIEMIKKQYSIPFVTIDAYDNEPLPYCDLVVYINGKKTSQNIIKNSDENGFFEIKAYSDDLISIVSSKDGYITNNYQVKDISMYSFTQMPIEDKGIMMELNPCESGGDSTEDKKNSLKEYDMKKKQGTFVFEYNTDFQADIFEVFDCRIKDIDNNNPIFKFDDTTNNKTEYATISFSNRIITVRVTSKSPVWTYKVNCPK